METRPPGITDAALRTSLSVGWGIEARTLDHAPVGFGSHHWRAAGADGDRWFITVDDLDSVPMLGTTRATVRAGLSTAFATAASLHDSCGLSFVVAPVPALDGSFVRDLDERYTIAVFRHVEGAAGGFDRTRGQGQRLALLERLALLHVSTPSALPFEVQAIPGLASIEAALDELSGEWVGGPWSEQARAWLRSHEEPLRNAIEAVRVASRADDRGHVVTHGEPHPGNVLETAAGPVLVDWDTVALAHPERDLWLVVTDEDDIARYERASGIAVDRAALARYARVWDLADVASYLDQFRRPHVADADTEHAWSCLAALTL
jgi:spectinomycin phosphotransferase